MARIIADAFFKKKATFGNDPQTPLNQKIIAVNNMYGWLYDQGLLEKVSFEFKECPDAIYFALDVKDLQPHRKAMEESNLADAELAVTHIFDTEYTPCLYSGAIELGWPMATYRDVDGCVGRSWECGLVKGLGVEGIYEVDRVKSEAGVKEAVRKLFSYYDWPQPKKATSLDLVIQNAANKVARSSSSERDPGSSPTR